MTETQTKCPYCQAPLPEGAIVHEEVNSQGTFVIGTVDGKAVHTHEK